MRLYSQWLLGLVIFSTLGRIYCQSSSIDDKDSSHQVYSYTYHFQHNGNTDPKQFIHDILPDPPQGESLVKTFDQPDLRGFVSKGFLPAGPLNPLTINSHHFKTPNYQDIKAIVQDNLNRNLVQPQSPISENIKNIQQEVNNELNRNFNNFNGNFNNRFPQVPPPPRVTTSFINQGPLPAPHIKNNNAISNVQTFEKDIPNGKVIERIETLSYNPPPIDNSVSINDGNHQEVNRHTQNAFGRTTSYFRKEFSNSNNFGPNHNVFNRNSNANNNGQWWNSMVNNNINSNKPQDFNRQWNNVEKHSFANPEHQNREINPAKKVVQNHRPVFGQRLRALPRVHDNNFNAGVIGNDNYINNKPHDNRNNILNNNHHAENFDRKFEDLRNSYRNDFSNRNTFQNDRTSGNVNNIIEKVHGRLQDVDRRLQNLGPRNVGRTFTWDDDDDKNWLSNTDSDWSKRSHHQPANNWNLFNQDNRGNFGNGAQVNNNNNPVDELKSTLQALVGNQIKIPNFQLQNGNGLEKTFNVDRVVEGPNSYLSDRRQGFERTYRSDTDAGYHRANQWSSNFERRLDAQSSRDEFSKDFIDVFRDDF